MRSARNLLKRAEMHVLRDVELWCADARSWRETQEMLQALRKDIDIDPVGDKMGLIWSVGQSVHFLAGAPGTHRPELLRLNESHSQYGNDSACRNTVASQHCVTPGKTNGLRVVGIVKAAEIRATGRYSILRNANVPVTENKAYLATQEETTPEGRTLSESLRDSVCLEEEKWLRGDQ